MLSYFPSRAQVPTRVPLTRANSFPFPSYLLLLMCSVSICIPGIILFQFMQEKKKKKYHEGNDLPTQIVLFQLRLCPLTSFGFCSQSEEEMDAYALINTSYPYVGNIEIYTAFQTKWGCRTELSGCH